MNIITHSLIGAAALFVGGPVFALYQEPFPFRDVQASVARTVMIEDTTEIPLRINWFVDKACPYLIERELYDSQANRLAQYTFRVRAPDYRGSKNFGAPFVIHVTPEPGRGLYRARIGAMCNPIQKLVPNWGPWVNVDVNFIPFGKRDRER